MYNKSEIMKRAWVLIKENGLSKSQALHQAWVECKIDILESRIFMLNMKDRWSTEDYDTNRKFHDELRNQKALLVSNPAAA